MPDGLIVDDCEREGNMLVQAEGSPDEIKFDHMELTVYRATLLKDLITAFCEPKVLNSILFVKLVDTNGVQESGEGRVLPEMSSRNFGIFSSSLWQSEPHLKSL